MPSYFFKITSQQGEFEESCHTPLIKEALDTIELDSDLHDLIKEHGLECMVSIVIEDMNNKIRYGNRKFYQENDIEVRNLIKRMINQRM
jgi:hypothetical protein